MESDCLKEVRLQTLENSQAPLLSVAMIAYNVEKYIVEAIESVLMQKVCFRVELVIGEDCSTDATREIVISYLQQFPGIIRVLAHKKNLGLTPNSVATQNACFGKYVALLDGDDFWTMDNKLQKQVEFLEVNPQYSACAHQSSIIRGTIENKVKDFGLNEDADFAINDTITHRKFHTSALVYRKEYWDKTGGIPTNISSNERAIYPMLAIFGKIKYFADNMCVYRITGLGLTSRVDYKELTTDLNMLPWLKKIDPKFPVLKFRSFLHLCIYTYGAKQIPFIPLLLNYFLFVVYSFSYFPQNFKDLKWGTIFFYRKTRELI